MNLSGGGVAAHAPNRDNAIKFLEYLASDQAQKYFSAGNDEYPAVPGVGLSPSVAAMGLFRPDAVDLSAVTLLCDVLRPRLTAAHVSSDVPDLALREIDSICGRALRGRHLCLRLLAGSDQSPCLCWACARIGVTRVPWDSTTERDGGGSSTRIGNGAHDHHANGHLLAAV